MMKKKVAQIAEQELTKQTTPEEVETNPVVEQATELQKVSPTVQSSKRAEEIAEDNQALCQATGENTEVVRKADRAELIA